jgi:hypothetical protein
MPKVSRCISLDKLREDDRNKILEVVIHVNYIHYVSFVRGTDFCSVKSI